MVPQCKYFPQNVTSLPKKAKIIIPRKATEKFVLQHTERGWREGERPLSTLSLSYKAVYPQVLQTLKSCQKITVKEFII